MIAYQSIINLFKEILESSKAIQGRFYLGYRYGLQDINYDNLGQTLDEIKVPKKYPLCMMAPPHSNMKLTGKDNGFDDYRITLFFMKESLREDIIANLKTSSHTIPQDWHDMKRVAVNFLKVLDYSMRQGPKGFVYQADHNALFIPLSQIGADRVSGIRLDFDMRVYTLCDDLEDYDTYPFVNALTDGHPEHDL